MNKLEKFRVVKGIEQKQGLRNFTVNIKPVMAKCKEGKKLTKDEQNQIVQFYLEVADYIFKD